jgi:hypothetical protein
VGEGNPLPPKSTLHTDHILQWRHADIAEYNQKLLCRSSSKNEQLQLCYATYAWMRREPASADEIENRYPTHHCDKRIPHLLARP